MVMKMENFTYETEDRKTVLEKYEWDNVWIENTDNNKSPRVLYIGDSISCGTRRIATMLTREKILFDGYGTSKAVDNPFFQMGVHWFASQLPRVDLILFNNGLHGFHLEDSCEYAHYYEEMVKFLLKEYANVPLYLLLTTYIRDEERLERVQTRNRAVSDIAAKYNLPLIDLYQATEKNKELLSEDGVHLKQEGYEMLSKEIISAINITLVYCR